MKKGDDGCHNAQRTTHTSPSTTHLSPSTEHTSPEDGGGGGDGYDTSIFLIPASDAQGHNSRVYCRVMPQVAQQMEYVMQSKSFPYRSKGDILRHALHRHLAYLSHLEPGVKSVLGQVDAICEVLREEEMSGEFRALFDKMGAQIQNFMGQGAEGEARRLILNVLRLVGEMPDGYWRDKYMSEIKSRWGHVVEKAPKVNLLGGGEGEE